MNTNKELERIVSDWLDDRAAAPPHGSLDSALARAGRTSQQHRWLRRLFGRRSGATRSAERGDTSPDSSDRRNRLMFSATAVAASVAALALAAMLVIPQGAGEPLPVPAAGGATHRVAADGSGDYQTINDALAAAEEGDTILVAAGTYTEYLLIDKDITLAGDGPREEIVVEFPDGGPAQVFLSDDDEDEEISFPIVLQGADAVLRGLTIVVPLAGGGVLVDGGAPELADLSVVPHPDAEISGTYRDALFMYPFQFKEGSSPVVRDSSWTGFLHSGGSSPTFEGNTITSSVMALDGPGEAVVRGNTFPDGAILHLDFDLTGIIESNDLTNASIGIGAGSSMTVKDNVVRDTRSGRGEAAIAVWEPGSSGHIVGNTVTGSVVGISVSDGAVATVEGNDLIGNDVAIQWSSTETGAIDGNAVREGGIGIEIVAGDPSVVDNTVEGASSWGMVIDVPARPTLEGNTVCGSGRSNLFVVEGADPVVGENQICPDGIEPAE